MKIPAYGTFIVGSYLRISQFLLFPGLFRFSAAAFISQHNIYIFLGSHQKILLISLNLLGGND